MKVRVFVGDESYLRGAADDLTYLGQHYGQHFFMHSAGYNGSSKQDLVGVDPTITDPWQYSPIIVWDSKGPREFDLYAIKTISTKMWAHYCAARLIP